MQPIAAIRTKYGDIIPWNASFAGNQLLVPVSREVYGRITRGEVEAADVVLSYQRGGDIETIFGAKAQAASGGGESPLTREEVEKATFAELAAMAKASGVKVQGKRTAENMRAAILAAMFAQDAADAESSAADAGAEQAAADFKED